MESPLGPSGWWSPVRQLSPETGAEGAFAIALSGCRLLLGPPEKVPVRGHLPVLLLAVSLPLSQSSLLSLCHLVGIVRGVEINGRVVHLGLP